LHEGIQAPNLRMSNQACVNYYQNDKVLKMRWTQRDATREASLMYWAGECSVRLIALVEGPGNEGGFIMERLSPIVPSLMDKQQKVRVMAKMGRQLSLLHQKGIIHGDIKLSNILLENDEDVKFCDFGSGALIQENCRPYTLSPRWCSPRRCGVGRWEALNTQDDWYALGVTVFELFAEMTPLETICDSDVMERIAGGAQPDVSLCENRQAIDFILACWGQQNWTAGLISMVMGG